MMFELRYYCNKKRKKEIREMLDQIEDRQVIACEVVDLSDNGDYNEEKEKLAYKRDFKPKAKQLKERTGKSITVLRSRKAGHYFVSLPGTMAITRDGQIEWFTLQDNEILEFLRSVLERGHIYLEECCH